MKLVKDTFFIDADENSNKKININGNEVYVDIDFDPYAFATKIGVVTHTPHFISDEWKNDNPVKEGDVAIFHQFVCQEDNKIILDGKKYFKANYYHLFAVVRDEKVIALENFIFVEPIKNTQEFIGSLQVVFDDDAKVEQKGIVRYISQQAQDLGINVGDIIHFTKNADYSISILGEDLFRMRIRNIVCVEREGSLICMNDKVLIKETTKDRGFISQDDRESEGIIEQVGSQIGDVFVGEKVGYFNGVMQPIEFQGDRYLLTKRDNINYIIK